MEGATHESGLTRVLAFRASLGIPHTGLTDSDAHAILRSDLLPFVEKAELDNWGIPLVHRAERVRTRLAGTVRGTIDAAFEGEHRVEVRVLWNDGKRVRERTVEYLRKLGTPAGLVRFDCPNERGERGGVLVRPGSVLADLRWEALRLGVHPPFDALKLTPPAAEAACAWLILTGRALRLDPLVTAWEEPTVSVDVITISALARVASPETVAEAYSLAQKKIIGHRKGRALASRSLAVVAFVEASTPAPERLTEHEWRELREGWNRRRPRRGFATTKQLIATYWSAKKSFFPSTLGG